MSTWQPTPPERGPRPVGEVLDATAARLGGPSSRAAATVFGRWEALVGPDIAAHTRPLSLHDGVLVVEVDHPVWATQLRFMNADLLRRVREATGGGEVAEIRLRVAGETPVRDRGDRPRKTPR